MNLLVHFKPVKKPTLPEFFPAFFLYITKPPLPVGALIPVIFFAYWI